MLNAAAGFDRKKLYFGPIASAGAIQGYGLASDMDFLFQVLGITAASLKEIY